MSELATAYVQLVPTATGMKGKIEKALKITTKGSFSFLGKALKAEPWQNLSPATIEEKLNDKGILNTFSCTHPASSSSPCKS